MNEINSKTFERLAEIGRQLVLICAVVPSGVGEIAKILIDPEEIRKAEESVNERERVMREHGLVFSESLEEKLTELGYTPYRAKFLTYEGCRNSTTHPRQQVSPTDEPGSKHSKSSFVAVYGYADLVQNQTGINPLIHDGSENSLPFLMRNIILLTRALVHLHEIQINLDQKLKSELTSNDGEQPGASALAS